MIPNDKSTYTYSNLIYAMHQTKWENKQFHWSKIHYGKNYVATLSLSVVVSVRDLYRCVTIPICSVLEPTNYLFPGEVNIERTVTQTDQNAGRKRSHSMMAERRIVGCGGSVVVVFPILGTKTLWLSSLFVFMSGSRTQVQICVRFLGWMERYCYQSVSMSVCSLVFVEYLAI